MTFAPPVKTKLSSRLAKSSWTPLSNPTSNGQVFEERREIMKKWFSKWQDGQKRIIVGDIVQSLSQKHLYELHENLNNKFPQEKFDFTKRLPRVLSLYLFSFLDPRTLCRCAQVSWYWNYLTELDSLWRPKCLKFGWYPTYQPSPYEEKIWKRFYVKTVHDLNYAKPKPKTPEGSRPVSARSHHSSSTLTARSLNETTQLTLNRSTMSGVKRGPLVPTTRRIPPAKWEPPPWKGSDPNPMDTVRFNVLDNKSKYAGKSKRSTSALNTARSLNTGRPKSSARSTRSKKKSTKLNESLDCDVINKNMDSNRSIKTSSKKGSVCDPFEDHGISRLSIDSGKRPQPVVKLESNLVRSPNTTLKESYIEEEKAESVKSSVKSVKSSKVSRRSSVVEKGESSKSSFKSASVKSVNVSRRSSVASNAKSSIVQKLMEKEASLRSESVRAESVKDSVKSESVSALEEEVGSVKLKSDSVDNASVKSEEKSVKSANISIKSGIASVKDEYNKNESVFMENEQASIKSEKNSVKSGLASLIDKSESVKDANFLLENDQVSVKSEKNSTKSGQASLIDKSESVKDANTFLEIDQASVKSKKSSVKSAVGSVKDDYNEHESVSIVNDNASVKSGKVSISSEKNSVKGDEANEEDKFSVKSSGLKASVAGSHRSSVSGKQLIVEDDDDDDVIEEEIAGDVSAASSHVAVDESISNLHGKGWKIQASDDEDF